jgi:hypothetical protein
MAGLIFNGLIKFEIIFNKEKSVKINIFKIWQLKNCFKLFSNFLILILLFLVHRIRFFSTCTPPPSNDDGGRRSNWMLKCDETIKFVHWKCIIALISLVSRNDLSVLLPQPALDAGMVFGV